MCTSRLLNRLSPLACSMTAERRPGLLGEVMTIMLSAHQWLSLEYSHYPLSEATRRIDFFASHKLAFRLPRLPTDASPPSHPKRPETRIVHWMRMLSGVGSSP